ncbi:hypothetical protein [Paracoccus sp. DMF]|uniref:hypothetical protein n=1 Tax=Paracoccus sp. DMF TaxID=400837 RepID=UPI0011023954|nr:hypothetical protein [Paracoccus sp. DMF]MCV2448444.1 hypothetical protein [Paracoccus sp. DMF]
MALTIGALAIINTLGYLAVIWAFRASFRELNSATWWFAMGFAILAGAIIARGLYWDVSLPLMRLWVPEFAASWSEATRGRLINIVFSAMKMVAFFCALKCRQKMIPEEERSRWPWWRAWLHPTKIRLLPWW